MTAAISHLSHPKYRPDIDGLRAVAVISVVTYHAFPAWIKGGFIGVDIFFVISGFLISTIIFENLDKGTFGFSEFYSRRVRRIFPALILVLLFCLILGWLALLSDELNQLGKHVAAGAGFISNIVLLSEAGYFDNSAESKPLLHLWSLGIEEQFYIIWPFVLWFAWKRKFNLFGITLVIAVLSFCLNLYEVKRDAVAAFYSPQTRFWELLCGSLLAWFVLYKKESFDRVGANIDRRIFDIFRVARFEATGLIFSNFLALSGCVILTYAFWRITKDSTFPGVWAIFPVLGATLLILAGPSAWFNRVVLSNRIAVWFGLISFPLYLWHWPLFSFVRIVKDRPANIDTGFALIFLSIALAWATVRFIEKPLRYGDNIRLKLLALSGAILALGSMGFMVSRLDLSEGRGYEELLVSRRGTEHFIGPSRYWYKGKNGWYFLGNAYDETVAKLKLAKIPTEAEIAEVKRDFSEYAEIGRRYGAQTILMIGPNKSSIYPEHLPNVLKPSERRYINFFLDELHKIPGLVVYDPTADLLAAKSKEGILYRIADTHWNQRGAYVAYIGLMKKVDVQSVQVEFKQRSTRGGDLIEMSVSNDSFPDLQDDWNVVWNRRPAWTERKIANEQKSPFGSPTLVINKVPVSEKHVWVIGDSYTDQLKQYLNATFGEIRYVGHWRQKLKTLEEDLMGAERKPDLIIINKVERSF